MARTVRGAKRLHRIAFLTACLTLASVLAHGGPRDLAAASYGDGGVRHTPLPRAAASGGEGNGHSAAMASPERQSFHDASGGFADAFRFQGDGRTYDVMGWRDDVIEGLPVDEDDILAWPRLSRLDKHWYAQSAQPAAPSVPRPAQSRARHIDADAPALLLSTFGDDYAASGSGFTFEMMGWGEDEFENTDDGGFPRRDANAISALNKHWFGLDGDIEQAVEPAVSYDDEARYVATMQGLESELRDPADENTGRPSARRGETGKDEETDKDEAKAPGLYDSMLEGMMAVNPDDFDQKTESIPMDLRQVVASVLRENRAIQVAAYKPQQMEADIMANKAVYDPEVFADWTHSRSEAPAPVIISGVPTPNRDFRNEVGRIGLRQHVSTGAKITAYREWNNGVERNPGSAQDRGHGGAYVAEITQPILNGFADMENRTLIQISRLQTDMSKEEFRQTVIETMSKAMEAYWTVALAKEELKINEESLDLARRLLNRELGRRDEGISTQLDVNRAREAVATRAYNVNLSREQEEQAQENLKYLMNDKAVPVGMDIHVEAIEKLETPLVRPNMEKAIDIALANRPEMHNAELAMKTADARRRYAKHTLLPTLNLVGSVRHNDKNTSTPTTGSSTLYTGTDWSAGVEFSMPIGSMKARANMRKAESEMSQVMEEKRHMRDIIITEIRTLVKNIELVVREIPLNERAMVAAERVLEGEWARLELDQIGNRDLLQAQDLVAVTRRNYVNSMVRYNIYIVRLFAAQGVLLEKMGLRLR